MSYSKHKNLKKLLDKSIIFDEYISSLSNSKSCSSVLIKSSLYDILEINPSSSDSTIKKAYKKQIKIFHPDKGGTTESFQKINEAYNILSNERARQIYDEYGLKPACLFINLEQL